MLYRQLGRTGLTVSEIGFGAWGIGGGLWQGSNDAASLEALHTALDAGLTFIDTALAYGDGHSERLIGRALEARRESVVVATKVPPKNYLWPAARGVPLAHVFPAEYVRRCAETSAANLGRPVDVLQFHVWRDEWRAEADWRAVERTLEALLAAGTVRHLGISVNDHEPESALVAVRDWDLLGAVQVIYNIYDRSPERELFPACHDRGVGVIVRVPLDEGGLTGTIVPGVAFRPDDFRSRYFRDDRPAQVAGRLARLEPVLRREAGSLVEGALRFCLSHPAIGTVIPGMRTAAHARANCAVSDGRRLSPALLADLRAHVWERNFYA